MAQTVSPRTGLDSRTTYERWAADQGIPTYYGSYAHLNQVELKPWKRVGGNAAFTRLTGNIEGYTDGQVVEIAPGAQLQPQKHLYEETVFILKGRGTTVVWYDDDSKQTFEWQQNSLFAIPPNAWYQHFNLSGTEPARYYAVTDAPLVLDLFHNNDFVFNNDFRFTDRFDGSDSHFNGQGAFIHTGNTWDTNYVADVGGFELHEHPTRGGGRNILFELGNSTLVAHVSEFPVGTYKKAHRHGPGASVIIISGTGYTLHWHASGEYTRIDWVPGTTFVPEDNAFHQHFNTGQEAARYLAIRWGAGKYRFFRPVDNGQDRDVNEGGNQIEWQDEDPYIYETYAAECAKHGVTPDMAGLFAKGGRTI
jgi:uncharacterized RmlC-like cupin family protein